MPVASAQLVKQGSMLGLLGWLLGWLPAGRGAG